MLRNTLILTLFVALGSCRDIDDSGPAAEAVAAEMSTNAVEAPQLVTVAGTVRVFGQEDVSLSGVSVCEETTSTCTTTDGAGGFELFAPAGRNLTLVASGRDIFDSLLPLRAKPDVALDLRVMPRLAGEAFAELADGDLTDDTGMAFVVMEDRSGDALPQMWMTIRDFAAWGPIYTEPGIVPALERKFSGAVGFGAYLELPEGNEEIGVGGQGRHCTSPHWPTTDEDLFRVPVRGNTITWLHVVCE